MSDFLRGSAQCPPVLLTALHLVTLRSRSLGGAYRVDIGKNVFHVVALDSGGEPVQRTRFRRDTVLQFFERVPPAIVGMEPCAGSQWIARRLQALGHKVRLIPAQFVKPYVKSNTSDIIDAEAIAEAATRPTMRFGDGKRGLMFLQNPDDLVFREAAALHVLGFSMG